MYICIDVNVFHVAIFRLISHTCAMMYSALHMRVIPCISSKNFISLKMYRKRETTIKLHYAFTNVKSNITLSGKFSIL